MTDVQIYYLLGFVICFILLIQATPHKKDILNILLVTGLSILWPVTIIFGFIVWVASWFEEDEEQI